MNVIDPENLFLFFSDGPWFGEVLREFFKTHAAYAPARPGARIWHWSEEGATESCIDAAWDMLGSWQARRAVKVDPRRFVREVPAPIHALTETLNRYKIDCLGTLGDSPDATREAVAREVFRAVEAISRIKPTKTLSPMFGSKVVHHYFPSIVPVFDDAKVRQLLMKSDAWNRSTDPVTQRWERIADRASSEDPAMGDFQVYFAYCAAQIESAHDESLREAREVLGDRCVRFAPKSLRGDSNSLIWRLDAKVAEFCGCGIAQAELDGVDIKVL